VYANVGAFNCAAGCTAGWRPGAWTSRDAAARTQPVPVATTRPPGCAGGQRKALRRQVLRQEPTRLGLAPNPERRRELAERLLAQAT